MEQNLFSLSQLFDHFSDAVLFFPNNEQTKAPAYSNGAAASVLQDNEFLSLLPWLLVRDSSTLRLALSSGDALVTIAAQPAGRLLILRPLTEVQEAPSFGAVTHRLRQHLAQLFAISERFSFRLLQEDLSSDYEGLLSMSSKTLHQILRLVQQVELLPQDALSDFPLAPLDFSSLCRDLSQELSGRMDGSALLYAGDIEPGLFLVGNSFLLEHLILSLLSNAMMAAGPLGQVSLSLKKSEVLSNSRVELTVRDNGPGIPQDRLSRLFCHQSHDKLPRPEDGNGLDLYLSHRIATLHKGVLMAASSPGEGTQFTLSLPWEVPQSLSLRSPDLSPWGDRLSPVLTGLSNILPASVYSLSPEEH